MRDGWIKMTLLRPLGLLLVTIMLAACGEAPAPVASDSTAAPQTAQAVAQPAEPADFSGLMAGWNAIAPGGDTICSDGSEFRFYVKQGDPHKLMFYLEGGGACWEGGNCDPDIQPSYQVNLSNTDPSRAHGILAFDQVTNPVADFTMVYVPYCSADVHLGDSEQHYQMPAFDDHAAHDLHIRHSGWANAKAALDWTYGHLFDPQTVFVTGSSAGSIPSPFYAVKLAEQYPNADVVQLGDASGGYRGFANFNPYDVWNLDDVVSDLSYIETVPADTFSFHHLYLGAAQANPTIRFASYDNAEDETQKQFLALGGTPTESLQALLSENLMEISQAIPDFRFYVAGGDMHTILLRPEVYTYVVDGVRFVDWLAGLINNIPVTNVMCEDCSVPPESPVQR
jgi:hypothetical protein